MLDKDDLLEQIDAAIDVLDGALRACPEELWEASMWHVPRTDPWIWPAPGKEPVPERTDESIQVFSSVWAVAYHCLWFLDFYVTADPAGFETPEYVRGGMEEMDWPADGAAPLPDRVLGRDELLRYLEHGRRRVHEQVRSASPEALAAKCPSWHPHAGKSMHELLLVNLAHLREHGSQIDRFVHADRA